MKKPIIIYSLILIAVLTFSFTAVPHTSAQTQNVKILTHSWYIDNLGYLVVVGEIQNTGPNTIFQVSLGGTAQSSDGLSVDAMETPAWVQNFAPNQKAPFYIEFYDQNNQNYGLWMGSDVSNIDLQVLRADPTQNYSYPDVKVQSSSGALDAEGVYWVTGSLKNAGTQTAEGVVVFGTFYNSLGTVVAVGPSDFKNPFTISPSGTTDFRFGAWDLNQTTIPQAQKIASYSLLVQVTKPVLVGTAPIVTPYPGETQTTPDATQGSGGPTGFPPGQNPSTPTDNTTTIIIVVAVAVALAIAAAVLMLRRRKTQTQETNQVQRNQPKKTPKRERC